MSFLLKPEVTSQLIKASLKFGQANPNIIDLAKKLSNNLSKQFSTPNTVSAQPNTKLNINNLNNLNSLLNFLDENKVKLNNERIAYKTFKDSANPKNPKNGEPVESISDSERSKLDPITVNSSRDAFTKKWNESDYLTNIPNLIKYVSYLQEKAKADKLSSDNNQKAAGELLEVLTTKLIDSINIIKPDSGLTKVEKSEPGKPKELEDTSPLDFFGTKIFDPKNYFADNGTGAIKLTAADLKTKETLNNWLLREPEAQIVSQENNKSVTIKYNDPNSNPCIIINTLYLRAKYKVSRANNEEASKAANFYLRRIQEIGKSFTDAEGKVCSIISIQPNSSQKQDQIQQKSQEKTKSIDFSKIAQLFPLRVEDISFTRINTFLDAYLTIVSDDKKSELAGIKQLIQTSQQDIKQRLKNSDKQSFSTSAGAGDIAFSWLKFPPGTHYSRFLESLNQVVEGTEEALGLFKLQFADDPDMQKMNSTELSWLFAQIGKSPSDNSIAYRNKSEIRGWMNQVSAVNQYKVAPGK